VDLVYDILPEYRKADEQMTAVDYGRLQSIEKRS